MRRDTLAFTIAGILFGLLVGYMAAGWNAMPRPTVAPATAAGPPEFARPTPAPPDPDQVRTLESLAARQLNDARVRVALGNLHMDHESWDDAIRWYREALALAPGDPDVTTDLGACYVHSGRPAEGLAEFDRVLERNPEHRNARFNRGVALLDLARPSEAADTWEELLRRHPDDPELQRLRGRIEEIRTTVAPRAASSPPGAR